MVYAGSTMLLTALVNHLLGADKGGIFGFAFSTFGQQMFLVAYFGIRPLQSTDIERCYTFSEYRLARLFTCLLAVIFGVCYLVLWNGLGRGYGREKVLVVFFMVLYKVLDGFADVYETEFQRNGRLYLTGQAMTWRTLFAVFVFLGVLWGTRNLVVSSAAAAAAQGAGIVLFDKWAAGQVPGIDYTRKAGREQKILQDGGLLFLSVFLDGLIFAMAKYAVDAKMTSTDSAIFVAIFLPTAVINLAANFVIRPFLTHMSFQWHEGRLWEFVGGIKKQTGIIVLLTAAALLGAGAIGVPVLGAVSNVELSPYRSGLLLVILGGGFFALLNLFYYVLVIMKRQKGIFLVYIPVCVLSAFLSFEFAERWGINGAACSYMLEMFVLAVCFGGQAVFFVLKAKGNKEKMNEHW